MFCTRCGSQVPDGSRFCPSCGGPVSAPAREAAATEVVRASGQPVPAAIPGAPGACTPEVLAAYVAHVAARLRQRPGYVPELGASLLLTTRFSAALANIHQYFLVRAGDGWGREEVARHTDACVAWALENYQGVPRGLQKGIGIYPIVLQHPIEPGALAYVREKPKAHFAAFALPTLVDPFDHVVCHMEATPVWGWAMWGGIKKVADEALAY